MRDLAPLCTWYCCVFINQQFCWYFSILAHIYFLCVVVFFYKTLLVRAKTRFELFCPGRNTTNPSDSGTANSKIIIPAGAYYVVRKGFPTLLQPPNPHLGGKINTTLFLSRTTQLERLPLAQLCNRHGWAQIYFRRFPSPLRCLFIRKSSTLISRRK